MKTWIPLVLALTTSLALPATAREPSTPPTLRLWRLDCGALWIADLNDMSDTRAYTGESRQLVGSCYLVQHGSEYLLWDTGLPRDVLGKPLVRGGRDAESLDRTVVEQLARIGVEPAQVTRVGMVRLPKSGAVLLTGDVAHFRENLDTAGVPTFNTHRAQSLASMDRFVKLARNLDATLVIQHDERDVSKLPAFPQAAE